MIVRACAASSYPRPDGSTGSVVTIYPRLSAAGCPARSTAIHDLASAGEPPETANAIDVAADRVIRGAYSCSIVAASTHRSWSFLRTSWEVPSCASPHRIADWAPGITRGAPYQNGNGSMSSYVSSRRSPLKPRGAVVSTPGSTGVYSGACPVADWCLRPFTWSLRSESLGRRVHRLSTARRS